MEEKINAHSGQHEPEESRPRPIVAVEHPHHNEEEDDERPEQEERKFSDDPIKADALTPQAESAKETLALYVWWKQRQARKDAFDTSGLGELYKRFDTQYGKWDSWQLKDEVLSPEHKAEYEKVNATHRDLERTWDDEEGEMLIRLVNIRRHLWT